jgi:dTDP-4-dehydrorhamnose reductase
MSTTPAALQLWGGVECTVNRVHDRYFCQLSRSGHTTRDDDLERFAQLGIRALRYPVLWERTAPDGLEASDWRWPDAGLKRTAELGIEPIVGLVHHGSGPRHTSLVDPAFPDLLEQYAGAVAARYPWVKYYTPVNEPLTTARFSGLYGVWYPHGRDEKMFGRALLYQCRAIVQAMRAIRAVNPDAALVQTDDLSKTYSTALLKYQADFQNQLRWLGWDLLCGRVDRKHPVWHWLTHECACEPVELAWFQEHPCPPAVIGVNYYVTSERFLDERVENYPEHYVGGNGRHRYVDIEAARVLRQPTLDVAARIAEAWERYHIPVAITEAHIDTTREDQLRWLHEVWIAADTARRAGADVRAVTLWALLGAHDWNCLVTQCRDYYEPGVFDVRSEPPRKTALAALARDLAAGRTPTHPVLNGAGWWKRSDRFHSAPVSLITAEQEPPHHRMPPPQPLLISGATGTLGSAFARICSARGLEHRLLSRTELDIAEPDSVERALDQHRPWAVINAAGYVRVDDAERDAERCFRENTIGPAVLARACARHGVQLLTFSSDLVFDGKRDCPYVESDPTAPLNVYGLSKARAERRVLERHPGALVVRTSAFFSPWDNYNFVTLVLRALAAGSSFNAADDLIVSPTYVPDLVHAALDLLVDGESGIWHLANSGGTSWADLAAQAAKLAGVDASRLEARPSRELDFAARRPSYSALASARGTLLPALDDALGRYLAHLSVDINTTTAAITRTPTHP